MASVIKIKKTSKALGGRKKHIILTFSQPLDLEDAVSIKKNIAKSKKQEKRTILKMLRP